MLFTADKRNIYPLSLYFGRDFTRGRKILSQYVSIKIYCLHVSLFVAVECNTAVQFFSYNVWKAHTGYTEFIIFEK